MLHIWCYIHWFPDDNYFEIWPDHFEWSKSKSLILIGFQSAYGNGLCWISNNIVFLCSDYKKMKHFRHIRGGAGAVWTKSYHAHSTSQNIFIFDENSKKKGYFNRISSHFIILCFYLEIDAHNLKNKYSKNNTYCNSCDKNMSQNSKINFNKSNRSDSSSKLLKKKTANSH